MRRIGVRNMRLLTAKLIFAAGVSITVAPADMAIAKSKEAMPIPPAARPIIILSFIAGVDPSASSLAEHQYTSLDLGKRGKSADSNAIYRTASYSGLWIPYYYAALVRRLGAGSVVLDPLIAFATPDGKLELRGHAETSLAVERVIFVAYNSPYGTADSPGPLYSRGHWLTPLVVHITKEKAPYSAIAWTDFVTAANVEGRSVQTDKVDTKVFDYVIGASSYQPDGLEVKTLGDLAVKETATVRQRATDVRPLIFYQSIVGINSAKDSDYKVASAVLKSETEYRSKVSQKLVEYLSGSDASRSIKNVAVGDDKAIRQKHEASTMMFLSMFAGAANAAAGNSAALALDQNIAMNAAQQHEAASQELQAFRSLPMQQVTVVTTDISGIGIPQFSVNSVEDLRVKYRNALTKSDYAMSR